MSTFHLAVCQECTPVLPMPFGTAEERDEWADAHRAGTGHRVVDALQENQPDGEVRIYQNSGSVMQAGPQMIPTGVFTVRWEA